MQSRRSARKSLVFASFLVVASLFLSSLGYSNTQAADYDSHVVDTPQGNVRILQQRSTTTTITIKNTGTAPWPATTGLFVRNIQEYGRTDQGADFACSGWTGTQVANVGAVAPDNTIAIPFELCSNNMDAGEYLLGFQVAESAGGAWIGQPDQIARVWVEVYEDTTPKLHPGVTPDSPDLVVTGEQIRQPQNTYYTGDAIPVNTRIKIYNYDGQDAAASYVGFWVSNEEHGNPIAGSEIITRSIPALSYGLESDVVTATLPLTDTLTSGNYYIVFEADTLGEIDEYDEGNNRSSVVFTFVASDPPPEVCTTDELIAAINEANSQPTEPATINVSAPGCVFELAEPENSTYGATGLPVITSPITINGNNATMHLSGTNEMRLFLVDDSGHLAINNLTMRGGNLTNATNSFGGAIYNRNGTLELTDVLLENNTAQYGGALFTRDGTSSVVDSLIQNNTALTSGGGIYNAAAGRLNLTSVVVNGNTAGSDESDGKGGGLYNSGSLNITETTLSSNNALGWASGDGYGGKGGGLYNVYDGTITLMRSMVGENLALTGSKYPGKGGGIYHAIGTMNLTNVTIGANTAQGSDAASGGEGGGIYQASGSIAGSYTTIANNKAEGGTGLSENRGLGGGIYNDGNTLTLTATILSGNNATGRGHECWGTMTSMNYNLVEKAGFCDFEKQPNDSTWQSAKLLPVASNGGTTWNYQPAETSPVIDVIPAGANVCTTGTTDQRGEIRTGACDLGSHEFTGVVQPEPPVVLPWYANADIWIAPTPIIAGHPVRSYARIVNDTNVPQMVDVIFSIRGLGMGQDFVPIYTVRGYELSPNTPHVVSSDLWTPSVSGHFCMRVTVIGPNSIRTFQRNFDSLPPLPFGGCTDQQLLVCNPYNIAQVIAVNVTQQEGPEGCEATPSVPEVFLAPGQCQQVNVRVCVPEVQCGTCGFDIQPEPGHDGVYLQIPITGQACMAKVSIADAEPVFETDNGQTFAVFPVKLSQEVASDVTVACEVQDGTNPDALFTNARIADSDVDATCQATIPAGSLEGEIRILINGDTKYEYNEDFRVVLTDETEGAMVDEGAKTGTGTILNDDEPPRIAIDDATLIEGDHGERLMAFDVSLLDISGVPVSIEFVSDLNRGTATVNKDYRATAETLTFEAEKLSTRKAYIPITGEKIYEHDEDFYVTLRSPIDAQIASGQGEARGVIENDDDPPVISIDNVYQDEGDDGETIFVFTVYQSVESEMTTSIQYHTQDKEATLANNDYAEAQGTLTIAPGELSGTIEVHVTGDTKHEPDETFSLILDAATNATLPGGSISAVGTIDNDDTPPKPVTAWINKEPVEVVESDVQTVFAKFTVEISEHPMQDITIGYKTRDGNGKNGAIVGEDYVGKFGSLTFTPGGPLVQTISVEVKGDTINEGVEHFFVEIDSTDNVQFTNDQGQCDIRQLGDCKKDGLVNEDDKKDLNYMVNGNLKQDLLHCDAYDDEQLDIKDYFCIIDIYQNTHPSRCRSGQ